MRNGKGQDKYLFLTQLYPSINPSIHPPSKTLCLQGNPKKVGSKFTIMWDVFHMTLCFWCQVEIFPRVSFPFSIDSVSVNLVFISEALPVSRSFSASRFRSKCVFCREVCSVSSFHSCPTCHPESLLGFCHIILFPMVPFTTWQDSSCLLLVMPMNLRPHLFSVLKHQFY